MVFSKLKIAFLFAILALGVSSSLAATTVGERQYTLKIGVLENDAPASMRLFTEKPSGIGYELVDNIIRGLPLKPSYVFYQNRKQAIDAIKANQIQVLVGSYEENPDLDQYNISSTSPYYIDELAITTTKKEISMVEILSLIFNRLFMITLIGSLLIGTLFSIILFFLEKDKHPHFKDCPTYEKVSYSFFTIFSCFFRDLLYDPVTSLGRILFGVWMILSVFVITILGALVTSSVLHLMNHGGHSIHNIEHLRNSSVGMLYGQTRLEKLLKKSGATTVEFLDSTTMFEALRDSQIDHVATARTNLNEHYKLHPEDTTVLVTSTISLGYEAWTLYMNKHYGNVIFGKPLIESFNHKINTYRKDFQLYAICSHYIPDPAHCVF